MANLTPSDRKELEQRLQARQRDLRAAIAGAMADTGRENFSDIIGRVRDPGEESVAEFVASTHLTLLERDVNELRAIEAALSRLREGTYGQCEACGREIERARLYAYPTAALCVEDARREERRRAGGQDITPSL